MGSTVEDLLAVLPADRVLTDPDLLAGHRRDEADLCDAGTPLAVVRPRDTAEVAAAVRVAGGDHSIFLGTVLDATRRSGEALLFRDGDFHQGGQGTLTA
jgi:hypothetical protein